MLLNRPELTVQLDGSAIPAYPGAPELFERGISSTLAPPTGLPGDGWRALFSCNSSLPLPCWNCWWTADLRPLSLACSQEAATQLTQNGPWVQIGNAKAVHG